MATHINELGLWKNNRCGPVLLRFTNQPQKWFRSGSKQYKLLDLRHQQAPCHTPTTPVYHPFPDLQPRSSPSDFSTAAMALIDQQ